LYHGARYTIFKGKGVIDMATKLSKPKAARRVSGAKPVSVKSARGTVKDANVLVRFDAKSKKKVTQAAASRGLSVSDYVRTRMLSVANQDIAEAETGVLRLSREHQIAFWSALQNPPKATAAQRRLGELVRSVL
jgi:uncharacterized protein (DUF1778 family)